MMDSELLSDLRFLETRCLALLNGARTVGFAAWYSGSYFDREPACGTFVCLGGDVVWERALRRGTSFYEEREHWEVGNPLCPFHVLGPDLIDDLFNVGPVGTNHPGESAYSLDLVHAELRRRLSIVRELIAFCEECECGAKQPKLSEVA